MDQNNEHEEHEAEAWVRETWGGSDPFSFLMRARYSNAYDQYFGVTAISAIEKRGHLCYPRSGCRSIMRLIESGSQVPSTWRKA
jgi:hypothetical protein